MFRSHEAVQLTTIFYQEREIRNQAYNRKILTESSSHNQLENVTNIEDNSFSKKLIDEKNETFNHAHDIFKSSENETEVDRINSMNIAKKLKK